MTTKQNDLILQDGMQMDYRQLVASIDGIFWEADSQTFSFTYVSEQAERMLGYPISDWLAPDFWVNHIHPDDREWAIAFCSLATDEHRNHSFEYRMIAADGRIVWLRDLVTVVVEEGSLAKLCGMLTDITDRKQAEEERKAYLWFLEGMDKINLAMQRTDNLEQMMSDTIDTALALFNCDRAWLISPTDPNVQTWHSVAEQARPEYPGALEMALPLPVDATHARFIQIVMATDGPVKFGSASPYPLSEKMVVEFDIQSALAMAIYPKDDAPYIFGLHQCSYPRQWTDQEARLFQEIGRRLGDALTNLLAYRHLQESELRYREVFENVSDLLVLTEVTEEGRFRLLDFNPAWEEILGMNGRALVGHFLDEFCTPEVSRSTQSKYRECLEEKKSVIYEDWLHTSTGHWYMHNTIVPIHDSDGSVYRLIAVGRNITEQRRAMDELKTSEARFRTFVDHATDAFFLHDQQGVILDINQQACDLLGYSREELIGQTPEKFDFETSSTQAKKSSERMAAGETVAFETKHRRKDGSTIPVDIRIKPFRQDGQQYGLALVRDMTEQKRAQEELTLFRTLLDHTNDAIEVIDPTTGCFLDVNEHACLAHGYTREEYLALTVSDLYPLAAAQSWEEIIEEERQAGFHVFESEHLRKDGSTFPVEINTNYISLDRDYLLAVVRDITTRKQAAKALQESEERYRALYEDNPTMYFTIDPNGIVLSVNRFGAERLGYTVAELTGESVLNIFVEEDKGAALQFVHGCIQHPGQVFHWRLRKVHKEGGILWVAETARAVHQPDGSLVLLIVCEDINERKRTEDALAENHALLNIIIEGTADAVFVKDLEGRYLLINAAGARFLGKSVEEVIGSDDRELFAADSAQNILERDRLIMRNGEAQTFESTATAAGVTRTYISHKSAYHNVDGDVVGLIGISRDITELKRLEEQFRQAQKMDALGRLAGGVAHDFNNLLTVINGYSELLLKRSEANASQEHLLTEIQKAGGRAASLTRQLLAFSRKQLLQPQVVNLNELLTELINMLRRLIGENIELAWRPDPTLGFTKIDPAQFEQVIINLAVNARDAMHEGGRLAIETYNMEFEMDDVERTSAVTAGRYVCVAVSDSGQGIDEETQSRIFEPFFTTKAPGQGTGLGLAMVYGFVKQSGGEIEVFSELGSSSTFTIYLPLVEAPVSIAPIAEEELEAALPHRNETILLVEDESNVRELVGDILRAEEYHVLEAEDPEMALHLAKTHQGVIDLLLTDIMMPQMDGRKLAQLLMDARAELKVLYMSGYTEKIIATQDNSGQVTAFLQKPFTIDGLLQKVRELLG